MAGKIFANIDTEKTSRLISDAMTGEIQKAGRYVLEFSVGAIGGDGTVFVKEDILLMTAAPPAAVAASPKKSISMAPDDSDELARVYTVLDRVRNASKRLVASLYLHRVAPDALSASAIAALPDYAEQIDAALVEALKNDSPF